MNRRNCMTWAVAGLASLAWAGRAAWAQGNWPSKPVRIIVPFAPGGATDIITRIMAEPLGRALGQSVIVENKGGGGGIIGAQDLVRSAPDGYTLGIATVSSMATNPAINPKVPYNPLTDFTPVVNIAATPNVIAVHPSFPAKDYAGFVAELKSNPGKYAHASSGTGSINHMLFELYKGLTGTQATHVPYRGSGPAINDVVAGQVPILLDNLPSSMPFIQDQRLVPIVLAAPQRLPALAQVPTFAEVGLEPVNRMAFYGILGPKGVPKDIVNTINAAVRKVVQDPAVRQRIEATGALIVADTPETFAQELKDEYETYKRVVAQQKLSLE